MTLKGKAAFVGVGWTPARRNWPDKSQRGMQADVAAMAIQDAGLRKEDINGLVVEAPGGEDANNWPAIMADYLGLKPTMASGINNMGASGATGLVLASTWVATGLADTVLVTLGGNAGTQPRVIPRPDPFTDPYGPVVAANGWYAQIARRHSYEYGTTDEQRFKVAADQRFNAQKHPGSAFLGQPITAEDVANSRLVADPLHLLECVMPCAGGGSIIVTSPERAKTMRNKPVYLLGAGHNTDHDRLTWAERITRSPAVVSAPRAFRMAGLGPQDMDFAQVYDCYTITVMVTLEDAGFMPKGESGPWYQDHDTTYKGDFPVNTHGGQLSYGQQAGNAGGFSQCMEATLQLMHRGGERQVKDARTGFVNG
jgi:acetyl-CoA acetyltransferase